MEKSLTNNESIRLSLNVQKWNNYFDWIELKEDKIFCKYCIAYKTSNEYASGINNPTKYKLDVHNESIGHKSATQSYFKGLQQSRILTLTETQIAEKTKSVLPINLYPIFRGCMFLAWEDIALVKVKNYLVCLMT